ncbi:unnamed protein product [Prorocentrum cordatum]|uniref:Uncharacterized protein n=1 Tax=Prorocentrum cordatum TaxID=2364126 RepID=A0ABN9VAR7_9DINO|nr:unnamed protein product [Polarella glacialis]
MQCRLYGRSCVVNHSGANSVVESIGGGGNFGRSPRRQVRAVGTQSYCSTRDRVSIEWHARRTEALRVLPAPHDRERELRGAELQNSLEEARSAYCPKSMWTSGVTQPRANDPNDFVNQGEISFHSGSACQ